MQASKIPYAETSTKNHLLQVFLATGQRLLGLKISWK
jgi:hypothetical protein